MAELNAPEMTTAHPCCAPEQQATCCEPSDKAECCDPSHGEGCGCAVGGDSTQAIDVRGQVRERYAAAAVQVAATDPGAGCCAPSETFDGGSTTRIVPPSSLTPVKNCTRSVGGGT
jgi:hypothetical protein